MREAVPVCGRYHQSWGSRGLKDLDLTHLHLNFQVHHIILTPWSMTLSLTVYEASLLYDFNPTVQSIRIGVRPMGSSDIQRVHVSGHGWIMWGPRWAPQSIRMVDVPSVRMGAFSIYIDTHYICLVIYEISLMACAGGNYRNLLCVPIQWEKGYINVLLCIRFWAKN